MRASRSIGASFVLACLFSLDAAADGYPVARPGYESPVRLHGPVLRIGRWRVQDGRLVRKRGGWWRDYFISRTKRASFLRVRVRDAARADMAVLFRARVVERRPLQLQGYGFSIDTIKGRVYFLRWDPGGVRDPGVALDVPRMRGLLDLEVCLWMAGPNFTGQVFDGTSKESLVTLSWSDPAYPEGHLGLYVHRRSCRRMSFEMTAAPVSRKELAAAAPLGPGQPWLDDDWLVVIRERDAGRIPEDLDGMFNQVKCDAEDEESEVNLVTTETGVVVLRELGIDVLSARAGVPYKYRVEDYFERASAPLEVKKGQARALDGVKDARMIERLLRAYAAAYPRLTRLIELGRSPEGRPLLALRIADDPDDATRPSILLNAAHHPREVVTPEYVLDAIGRLLEDRTMQTREWLAGLAVVAVPMVNPDGSHAFWHVSDAFGRKSRHPAGPEAGPNPGVDLNRNYPFCWGKLKTPFNSDVPSSDYFRGPGPASEPEVQAMMKLAEQERFVASISYHASASRILVPYSINGVDNPEPSTAWAVANEMIERFDPRPGGRPYSLVKNLYPVDGTDQDWLHHSFGTLAYLVEVPWSPTEPSRLAEAIARSRPAWQYLLRRWLAGPSLSVRVKDRRTKKPLAARILIEEIELRAGEGYTTNPRTGWFHHYLPSDGKYTVRARFEDRTASRSVSVSKGVMRIELEL